MLILMQNFGHGKASIHGGTAIALLIALEFAALNAAKPEPLADAIEQQPPSPLVHRVSYPHTMIATGTNLWRRLMSAAVR